MSLTSYGIITGAGVSIGRETGFTFAENGATGIIFAGRTEADLVSAAEESRKYATNPEYRAIPLKVDVTDRQKVREMFELAVREFGRVDFVCNSAGISSKRSGAIQDLETEVFEEVMDINAKGTFFVTSEAVRVMTQQEEVHTQGRGGRRSVGRGVIINLSSLAGQQALPNGSGYVASKFATVGITYTAAAENARKGIRINVVCPSWVESRMMDEIFERKPGWKDTVTRLNPAGRIAKAEEVAEAIYFLCSNGASYINAVALTVDSGFTQTKGYL